MNSYNNTNLQPKIILIRQNVSSRFLDAENDAANQFLSTTSFRISHVSDIIEVSYAKI